MMPHAMFTGAYTAIVTPFTKAGKVDEPRLRDLVEFQIANGIDGLVPCGTTGESPTLDHNEHNHVIELVIKFAAKRCKIIAGTGSNCTDEAITLTKHAKDVGADASLQVSPYYNKPTQAGLYAHFRAIAEASELPIIIYNIPGRCGVDVANENHGAVAPRSAEARRRVEGGDGERGSREPDPHARGQGFRDSVR